MRDIVNQLQGDPYNYAGEDEGAEETVEKAPEPVLSP